MRRILINIMHGYMMWYVMPAWCMELLLLEQQISALTHELVHQQPDANPRSIANLLKRAYEKKSVPFAFISSSSATDRTAILAQTGTSYLSSIKLPSRDGHLDLSIWFNQIPEFNDKQRNALFTFWRHISNLIFQVFYRMNAGKSKVEGLDKVAEFRELVNMLNLALPAPDVREKTGQEIVRMWREQLAATSPEQKAQFFKKYPDAPFWLYYFAYARDTYVIPIIFDALYIEEPNIDLYYDKVSTLSQAHRMIRPIESSKSIGDLLKKQYIDNKIRGVRLTGDKVDVNASKKLYELSLGLPLQNNNLNWDMWIKQSRNHKDELNTINTFWLFMRKLSNYIYNNDLWIENLGNIQEFNTLVNLLESALPAREKRQEAKQYLVKMWNDLIATKDSPEKKADFLQRYSDAVLWMLYFENIELSYALGSIFFEALLFSAKDVQAYKLAQQVFESNGYKNDFIPKRERRQYYQEFDLNWSKMMGRAA